MNRIYCCRCKKQFWGEEEYNAVLLDDSYEISFDEAVIENFTLRRQERTFVNIWKLAVLTKILLCSYPNEFVKALSTAEDGERTC